MASLEAGPTGPELAHLAEQFFDDYTPSPFLADFGVFLTPLSAARHVATIARPQPDERVLDFGAGLGVFAYALVEAGVPAGSVMALELSRDLYEVGSRLAPDVDWAWDNGFHETFWQPRMGQFDLVIGNPPWGRTRGREPFDATGDIYGDLLLVGNGNGRKSAVAEAMSLEVALRVLKPGGRVVFLLPANAFQTRNWSRYDKLIAPYEAGRETRPIAVDFRQTNVKSALAVLTRNERPFPCQFAEGDQVWWDDGELLTGIVDYVSADGQVIVKCDECLAVAGGVPIGRIEHISPKKLNAGPVPEDELARVRMGPIQPGEYRQGTLW